MSRLKRCSKCKKLQPLSGFHKNKDKKDNLNCQCKTCRSEKAHEYNANLLPEQKEHKDNLELIRKYGITRQNKNNMIELQNNRCLICGETFKSFQEQNIDHDHKTGKVRGILCNRCNIAIGCFKDNPILCDKGAAYLRGSYE